MSSLNQDLQASYQIISLLERSKANSEAIIDRLPDLFAIIEENGNVLKGNLQAAQLLGVDEELLLGLNISRLFSQETWNLFQVYLQQAQGLVVGGKPIEFELPVDFKLASERVCLWSLTLLEGVSHNQNRLYCLIGRDVTLLRSYQKQLADIFASIPLGIFTVDSEGLIEETYSAYTKFLLGRDQISGLTLKKLIFDPCLEYFDAASREGFENMMNFQDMDLREFDALEETFPKQIYFPVAVKKGIGRYLGLKVQSISHGQKVGGLLVILEDRTAIVEAEKADEKNKLLQDMSLDRALQIKKCDPDLLAVVMNDLKMLFSQLGDGVLSKDEALLKNSLHSIKGNARLAGFMGLMKVSHALEGKLKEKSEMDWEIAFLDADLLRSEWKELNSLYRIMSESDRESRTVTFEEGAIPPPKDSILSMMKRLKTAFATNFDSVTTDLWNQMQVRAQEISCKPLTEIENSLRHNVHQTADTLGKKVKLHFDLDSDLRIDEIYFPQVRSALMHLLNNSLDHGVETPEQRLEKKKSLQGVVKISAYPANDCLVISIEDDGRGLQKDRILKKAIENKLVTAKEVASWPDEKIFQLIFQPGFSTADKVSEVSGRGVGLDAVRQVAQSMGGGVEVRPSSLGGACFVVKFKILETET
jgi:PAS domain S-box-containing protein